MGAAAAAAGGLSCWIVWWLLFGCGFSPASMQAISQPLACFPDLRLQESTPQAHTRLTHTLPSPTPAGHAGRLITLRELLPGANVSALVAGAPQVLLKSQEELREAVGQLKEILNVSDREASW